MFCEVFFVVVVLRGGGGSCLVLFKAEGRVSCDFEVTEVICGGTEGGRDECGCSSGEW